MNSFRTEQDISLFLKKQIALHKVRPSFNPIVANVPGGSEPHHRPKRVALKRGFCVIDFGVKVNGYCSDMTRTVFFGKPTLKEKRLYQLVLNAQQKAIKHLMHGAQGSELYKIAASELKEHCKKFIHGLGHGLGKHIHTKPFFKKKSTDIVREGDIVTIEPGIYFKNRFGIRIEDDFFVTKNSCNQLSKSTRKLLCFKLLEKWWL